jgi:hypothetical protein
MWKIWAFRSLPQMGIVWDFKILSKKVYVLGFFFPVYTIVIFTEDNFRYNSN